MKKTLMSLLVLALLAPGIVFLAGCLDVEKTLIEIAVTTEVTRDIDIDTDLEVVDETVEVDFAKEADDALHDAGYTREDLKGYALNGASYGVIAFDQATDWEIAGIISVQRTDGTAGPVTELLDYHTESIPEALGEKIDADLLEPGVDVLNEALEDYINGGKPVIEFILGGSVDPAPGSAGAEARIIFSWRLWVQFQVMVEEEVKIVDPW